MPYYIIRASFSKERMQYLDQEVRVGYAAKDGKSCDGMVYCHVFAEIR